MTTQFNLIMQYTINQLRSEVFSQVWQVYEVFQNYFGEDSVDLQNLPDDDYIAELLEEKEVYPREDGSCYEGDDRKFAGVKSIMSSVRPFILVYWPTVRVTNENNKSILIQDLYAKIELDSNGRIPTENRGFLLNRATYPIEQWSYGYLHSHIYSVPKDDLTEFQPPCLGSGPILSTITSLKTDLSEGFDEIQWMLFCEELSRYVTVESIKGIPYKYLEDVNLSDLLSDYKDFDSSTAYDITHSVSKMSNVSSSENPNALGDFVLYYLKHGHLSFNFQNGEFQIGMTHFDYIIDISNSFIDYFNSHYTDKNLVKEYFEYDIIRKVIVAGNKFLDLDATIQVPDVSGYVGQKVCDFKGHEVKLNILSATEFTPQETIVLDHALAIFILNNILKIINYHYRNEYNRKSVGESTAETALTATTHQRVCFI